MALDQVRTELDIGWHYYGLRKHLLDGWDVEQLPKREDARLSCDFLYEID